ncbi:MAG: hypothetical protein Kow0069_02520 [Promethearchaeota archaeon]
MEKSLLQTLRNFGQFFGALSLELSGGARTETEVALEVPANALKLVHFQRLVRRGLKVAGTHLGPSEKMRVAIVHARSTPAGTSSPVDSSQSPVAKLFGFLEKLGLADEVVGGWIAKSLSVGLADRKVPLRAADSYHVRLSFDLSARRLKLQVAGQVADDFFRKRKLPALANWTWVRSRKERKSSGEEKMTTKRFLDLVWKGDLRVDDLRDEIEALENQYYQMAFYNVYDLADVAFRRGLAYLRLGLIERKLEMVLKARDAFRFVMSTDFKTSQFRDQVVAQLLRHCKACEETGRVIPLEKPSLVDSSEFSTKIFDVGDLDVEELRAQREALEQRYYTGVFLNHWDLSECRLNLALVYAKLAKAESDPSLLALARRHVEPVLESDYRTAEFSTEFLEWLKEECESGECLKSEAAVAKPAK